MPKENHSQPLASRALSKWKFWKTQVGVVRIIDSMQDIKQPRNRWIHEHPFLEEAYLETIRSNDETRVWWAAFEKEGKQLGWAVYHLSHFESDEIWTDYPDCLGAKDWLKRHLLSSSKRRRVLLCGNPYVTGNCGYWFDSNVSTQDQAQWLCQGMDEMTLYLRKKGFHVAVSLIKDFHPNQQALVKELANCGFAPLAGDPCMVLPIHSNWNSWEDYTQDMVSKFRSKALTAYKKSHAVIREEWDANKMKERVQDWYPLYEQVYQRAKNKWKKISSTTMIELKANMPENIVFSSYQVEDKVVAFSIAVCGSLEMEAHLVGFDHELNLQMQLYSRILYDFVHLGIDRKVSRIRFGRTATEMKSSIGALPVEMVGLMRFSQSIARCMINWVIQSREKQEISLREPWKSEVEKELKIRMSNYY